MIKRGNKKGQVTIFIIIAVLVVAIVAIFFIFRGKAGNESSSSEASPIYTKTISCLETTTQEGAKYIALKGGNYEIPEELSLVYFTDEVPYYYINSQKTMPSLRRVERELEKYITANLDSCVGFEGFEEQGFEIKKGDLTVNVGIKGKNIHVYANYPLSIKKGEDTSLLGEFHLDIASNIEEVYYACEDILNSYSLKPGFVCLTCLEDTSDKYDIIARATPLQGRNAIWFSVSDNEEELEWRFVVEE